MAARCMGNPGGRDKSPGFGPSVYMRTNEVSDDCGALLIETILTGVCKTLNLVHIKLPNRAGFPDENTVRDTPQF